MKKFFSWFGLVCFMAIIGGGTWLYFAMQAGLEMDKTSRAFVEREIPKLAKARWYGPHLRPIAHPAFLEAVSMERWQQISTIYWQGLGMMESFGECQGQAKVMYLGGEKEVTATYSCPASFAKGDATLETTLQQEDEQWKLIRLKVDSPVFLR